MKLEKGTISVWWWFIEQTIDLSFDFGSWFCVSFSLLFSLSTGCLEIPCALFYTRFLFVLFRTFFFSFSFFLHAYLLISFNWGILFEISDDFDGFFFVSSFPSSVCWVIKVENISQSILNFHCWFFFHSLLRFSA